MSHPSTLLLTSNDTDVGYLTGIIKQFGELYPYDRSQGQSMFRDLPAASLPTHRLPATLLVHALGQSNGAAMVYRLGCEAADIFASIIPFEGSPPPADYNCTPSEPVHLLHIHGTDDHTVYYDGKHRDMGAVDSVTFFGGYNGCGTGANATFLNNATIANAKYRGTRHSYYCSNGRHSR